MEDDTLNTEVEHRSEGDGDAGGGAAAEAELKAAEAALAAEHDDESDGDDGKPDTTGKPASRLQKRIAKLVEARKTYEKFGKPGDLERKLAKLDEYEKLEARLRREDDTKRARAREESGEAEVGRKMRTYLDQTYGPGANERIERMMQGEDARSTREAAAYAKSGRDHIESILTSNGVPTSDPQVFRAYEHVMSTFIHANPEMHETYLDPNGQRAALEEAFKFAASKMVNPILAAAGAGTYEQIAARKARALGSGRGTSASNAIDIEDEKPPKGSTPDQIYDWHKKRASRAWDAAIEADESGA